MGRRGGRAHTHPNSHCPPTEALARRAPQRVRVQVRVPAPWRCGLLLVVQALLKALREEHEVTQAQLFEAASKRELADGSTQREVRLGGRHPG